MIFLLLLVVVAGCSGTANKMDDIAESLGSEKVATQSSYGGGARMMVLEEPAMDMAVESEVMVKSYDGMIEPDIAPMPPYEEHYGDDVYVEQKIIRTASMTIEVEDYFLASEKTSSYAKKYGGFVSNSNAYKDHNGKTRGTLTIRIPELHYDALMAELSMLGTVERKDTNGQDVTEEYVDISARLNNAESHEERLVAMYSNASYVKEMLNVEREINRVREEIERYEGKLRYMESKVAMSTVSVTLYEKQPVVKQWGIVRAFKDAVENMLSTIRVMILLIGWLLPLLIIALIVGLIVRFAVRRKRRRK